MPDPKAGGPVAEPMKTVTGGKLSSGTPTAGSPAAAGGLRVRRNRGSASRPVSPVGSRPPIRVTGGFRSRSCAP